jgi:hypothetical protein
VTKAYGLWESEGMMQLSHFNALFNLRGGLFALFVKVLCIFAVLALAQLGIAI